ncbi:hypothetical protein [uncultured Cohaesibacter sp.]|uniref:hypothetical protein n=1 Tax=uncultured Cohaesibacter sp. TaxID=1002546 RepID=UPI0029C8D021|nr:hypothetical protein [uncultured Cohaesibacter sp.]
MNQLHNQMNQNINGLNQFIRRLNQFLIWQKFSIMRPRRLQELFFQIHPPGLTTQTRIIANCKAPAHRLLQSNTLAASPCEQDLSRHALKRPWFLDLLSGRQMLNISRYGT